MKEQTSELNALINLIDDPDEDIFRQVSSRLLNIGRPAIFALEKAITNYPTTFVQNRIEFLIHDIHIQWVKLSLENWIANDSKNLCRGAYIVSTIQYPDLEEDDLLIYLDELKKDVNFEINCKLTPLEKIKTFNHAFFEIHKYSGNYSNFYSPFNNYINHVFESRKGNPLSLSIVYLILAQYLGLPIYGINLPRNFVVAWVNGYGTENQNVAFYINPYNKGISLTKNEIDIFLQQQKLTPQESYYEPCSNIDLIRRLLLNLLTAYEQSGNTQRYDELNVLLKLF